MLPSLPAGTGGAAVFYSSAASDCTFLPDCIINISQSTCINNTASDAGAVGILADSVQASLTNNIFASNSAQRQFGALSLERNSEQYRDIVIACDRTSFINTAGVAGVLYTSDFRCLDQRRTMNHNLKHLSKHVWSSLASHNRCFTIRLHVCNLICLLAFLTY